MPPPAFLSRYGSRDGADFLTCSPLHDVAGFIVPVITSRDRAHDAWGVSDHHDLTSCWNDILVSDSTKLRCAQTGTVDNQVGFLAGVMDKGSVGNVFEDRPLEDGAILEALPNEPRKIDRGVDANGCEADARVDVWAKLHELCFRDLLKLVIGAGGQCLVRQ